MAVIFLFHTSTSASGAEPQFTAEKYVHVRFVPNSIQDLPNRAPGETVARPVLIDRTQYRFALDLYYQPGKSAAPAFVRGFFTGRRENHAWVTVDLSEQILDVHTAIRHNQMERETIASVQGRLGGREPTFVPFSGNQMVFRLINPRPPNSRETQRQLPPHLSIAIGVPDGSFYSPRDDFPMAVDVMYGIFNLDLQAQSVRHRKLYRGKGEIVPMSEAEVEMVGRYVTLAMCDERLRSRFQ